MYRIRICCMVILYIVSIFNVLAVDNLTVDTPAALFPLPGVKTKLILTEKAPSADGEVKYVIYDYTGKETAVSSARRQSGKIILDFKLDMGYHELFFPEYGQYIGLAVYPDVQEAADTNRYWCMDSGLTWSRWPHERKVAIVGQLKRKGISTFRERFSWWQTDTGSMIREGTEAVVRDSVYGERRILELLQDSPEIYRRGDKKNSFDYDLIQGAAGMHRLENRFGKYWNAFELWNEPFYNNSLPADQYVPTVKMMGAALDTIVVAGSFTPAVASAYLETCAESGFFDVIDIFSIHLYSSPESMYNSIKYFRDRLKKYGVDRLPIWVTESGTPGAVVRETGRPTVKTDSLCAVTTAMRGIECLTLGVRRYYPFYLQQHIEGSIAWGMSDFNGTPLRPLAVWLHAVGRIGGKKYLGDLTASGDLISSHVFGGDGDKTVAVIYGKPGSTVELPVVGYRAYGADGRALPSSGTTLVNLDGLTFLEFESERLEGLIHTETPNMVFYRSAGMLGTRKKQAVVIQPEYPKGQIISHSNNGYTVSEEAAERFNVAARFCNLGDQDTTVTVRLHGPGISELRTQLNLPAQSEKYQVFELNFRKSLAEYSPFQLVWEAESAVGNDRAVVLFNRPPSVRTRKVAFIRKVPIIDGIVDDVWRNAEWASDTTVRNDVPGELAVSPEEFRAQAKFLWGDAGLYFLVDVKDRQMEPAPDPGCSWMYDSLQIAISQYNSENDRNRFEWGFYLDNHGTPQKTTFIASTGNKLSEDSHLAIRRDDKAATTVYEGLISWRDLGSMNAIYNRNGMKFRLTFCVNDHNGGNRRWSEWSPGIASGKSTELFPELILVESGLEEQQFVVSEKLFNSGKVEMSDRSKFTVQSGNTLKIEDKPVGNIAFILPETAMIGPITLRFKLASTEWNKHNGTGFHFAAGIQDSTSGECYECWLAPSSMFGGITGLALNEKNAPVPVFGTMGKVFPPTGLFYSVELTVDASTRQMTLSITDPNGQRETVAAGGGKRNSMKKFDRIFFRTSGWGAGPFLLKDIAIIR